MESGVNQELPKPLMLLVALGQGGALFLLYRSMENQTWPHEQPLWLVPMATFLLAVPVFFLMLVRRDILVATTVYVLLYALLMVALATYIGWQLEPVQWVEEGSLLAVFGLTVAIASFKFLLYAQQLSSSAAWVSCAIRKCFCIPGAISWYSACPCCSF